MLLTEVNHRPFEVKMQKGLTYDLKTMSFIGHPHEAPWRIWECGSGTADRYLTGPRLVKDYVSCFYKGSARLDKPKKTTADGLQESLRAIGRDDIASLWTPECAQNLLTQIEGLKMGKEMEDTLLVFAYDGVVILGSPEGDPEIDGLREYKDATFLERLAKDSVEGFCFCCQKQTQIPTSALIRFKGCTVGAGLNSSDVCASSWGSEQNSHNALCYPCFREKIQGGYQELENTCISLVPGELFLNIWAAEGSSMTTAELSELTYNTVLDAKDYFEFVKDARYGKMGKTFDPDATPDANIRVCVWAKSNSTLIPFEFRTLRQADLLENIRRFQHFFPGIWLKNLSAITGPVSITGSDMDEGVPYGTPHANSFRAWIQHALFGTPIKPAEYLKALRDFVRIVNHKDILNSPKNTKLGDLPSMRSFANVARLAIINAYNGRDKMESQSCYNLGCLAAYAVQAIHRGANWDDKTAKTFQNRILSVIQASPPRAIGEMIKSVNGRGHHEYSSREFFNEHLRVCNESTIPVRRLQGMEISDMQRGFTETSLRLRERRAPAMTHVTTTDDTTETQD